MRKKRIRVPGSGLFEFYQADSSFRFFRMAAIWLVAVLVVVDFFLPVFSPRIAHAGSPFYLTIERSFSNTETPEVRLDYTVTQKPLRLRVLRPENLERFLDGQLQISRSYEVPVNELNPGFYFVTGLNKVVSPLRAFRGMLDKDFRKSFKDTTFHEALRETTRAEIVSPPEEVILGPPDGFTLVSERFVDLEFGGVGVRDPGWWFGDSSWNEDRYQIRKISLAALPDGVYLLQAVQGKTEAQCLLQVSSLSVQVKQSSGQLVVRVINRELDPVAGAAVSYRDGRGKWQGLGKTTNAFGELVFANPEGMLDGRLVIKVETADQRRALVETDFLPTTTKDNSVFVVTDRPIFKPGESFFYKGVVRSFEDGELTVPPLSEKEARVTLIRSDGAPTDLSAVVPVTAFGSFSGGFDLDEAQTPGLYRLVAEIGQKPYGGEFRVRDYVKPTFYLELIDRSPTVVAGEPFFVKFKARRYSGGVPRGVKFEVFFYRKKFETPQFVMEAGGGLSAQIDYHGEIRSAASLTELKRIFSSVEARLSALGDLYAANSWDSAPILNESGEGEFTFQIPKAGADAAGEWVYSLMVRAMDPAGGQAVATENLFMTLSEAQPSVQFSTPVAPVGDKDQALFIRSTYPDGKPAPNGGGVIDIAVEQSAAPGRDYLRLPFTTDATGSARIALPELVVRGRLTAVATLETLAGNPLKHRSESQPAVMIVGGAPGEAILENRDLELYTTATVLSPGDKARVFALLPANWGKAGKGTLWETIAGSKVFDTRTSEFQGRSCWFEVEAKPEYGTGFYHTLTVPMGGGKYREQTLGFRIIPREKRLEIAVHPEGAETEPLKPFRIDFEVRDAAGGPAADTELAVTIVDRAVYAVQSELRPGVFDFFYPLPRLNLSTFYSDDLQGYGYADLLKKPNFKLGALKSQSKLTKKAMRDTAGWFPHVVTDAAGRASLTVDMPANVTEWLVTAIATDKNGRVGEARGQFQTVSDLSVEVLAPQFLREGEAAGIQVKTVNHLAQSVAVTSRLEMEGEAALKMESPEAALTLEPKGEHSCPLVLEAKGDKGVAALKVALATPEKIHVGGVETFEIPLKPSAMPQVFAATPHQDRLTTALPAAATIREVKVQVNSGLLGAALNSAAVLVSYPYGCTEQLAHSTIPNLVLLDLVRAAGISRDQLGPLAQPLTRAEKNAAIGIRKLSRNQKTDGGFGLWPGDPASSLPVTLTALSPLKFAKDLKIEGAARSFNKGVEWLSRVKPEVFDREGSLFGFELSRISEMDGWEEPWKEEIAYVAGLKGRQDFPLSDLIYALRIFVAHKEKSWSPFNEHFKDTGVQEELIGKLQEALDRFDPQAIDADPAPLAALGFGFQVPGIVSAGAGVLDELNALPEALEMKLKRILLSQLRNGFWISTFDTAQVIFNSRGVLRREAAAFARERAGDSRRIVVRKKDGAELGVLSRIPSGFVGNFPNPGGAAALSELRMEGLDATDMAGASIFADVPFGAVAPASQGLVVERTFFRVTGLGSEPLDLSQALHVGDLVVSEVRVRREASSETRPVPSRFLVVEDGVPSLAQVIDEDETYLADAGIQARDATYWNSIKETQRHPDKTVRIAKVMSAGELRVYQVWRVAFTGTATIPPARAFDMYDESLQGNTEAHPVLAK
ncbi:MAG: alpha-2-macroglobulin family protein [Pseudomonadota bacterium]